MKATFTTLWIFTLLFFSNIGAQAQVFVKADATGANDGSSWADAFTSLQDGMAASEGMAVWVAAGTYHPAAPGGGETATFAITTDMELYGGFAGTESSPAERDIAANPTILSGDLDDNDIPGDFENNRDDNVQTVLTVDSIITNATLIDGFIIMGGHADGPVDDPAGSSGGGIFSQGYPQIVNCTFSHNFAGQFGGGMFRTPPSEDLADDVQMENCAFTDNWAGSVGGGFYYFLAGNDQSFEITGGLFANNFCGGWTAGAAIGTSTSAQNPTVSFGQCEFDQNESKAAAGLAVFWNCQGGNISATNCTFTGNMATFEPETFSSKGGGFNIYHNPDASDCYGLVENCLFKDNVAASLGGGFGVNFQNENNVVDVINCEFENNSTTELASDWGGGAISGEQYSAGAHGTLNIHNCLIKDNPTSGTGGGIDLYAEGGFDVNVQACEFINNTTENFGMSIHTTGFLNTENAYLTVANSLFTGHGSMGNAIVHNKELFNTKILNCTFTANENVGILQESVGFLQIQNSILHSSGGINLMVNSEATSLGGNLVTDESMDALLTADDLQVEDPMFVGTGDHPYQLSEYSPAINAGTSSTDIPEFDLAGNDRIQSSGIDIGAYESPFDMTISSAEELVDNQSLTISPNPAGAHTSLTLDNEWAGELEVRILNAQGQVVQIESFDKTPEAAICFLEIGHLESGVYTLSISNGEAMIAKRLVKK